MRDSESFSGWKDFESFLSIVKEAEGLTEVAVKKPYSNVGLVESWYECSKCGNLWLLVEPDPPFNGLWKLAE